MTGDRTTRNARPGWIARAVRKVQRAICRVTGAVSVNELASMFPERFDADGSRPLSARGKGEIRSAIDRQTKRIDELVLQNREVLAALGERGLTGRVKQVNAGVHSVLRRLYLDAAGLAQPHALLAQRFGILSQNGEDGLTLAIFKLAGVATRRFVEIGSGVNGGNSGFLAEDCGWNGLMIDGSAERIERIRARFGRSVTAVSTWITRDNVNGIIADHGFSGEIDLLSVDIDGNDYWVWEAITTCRPRLVIAEFNVSFGPDRAVTVPYAEDFDRHRFPDARYYGASLAALTRLATRKGYRLVVVEPRGVNAYFLRADLCPELPARSPESLFKTVKPRRPHEPDLFDSAERYQLPLVEIE